MFRGRILNAFDGSKNCWNYDPLGGYHHASHAMFDFGLLQGLSVLYEDECMLVEKMMNVYNDSLGGRGKRACASEFGELGLHGKTFIVVVV